MESAQEAAIALKFNRTLVQMARTVINGMKQSGVAHYNGAHLRLEKDAVDWARVLGGLPKYLAEYAKSFAAAGFTTGKDLYIASGLLSYDASAEMTNMLKFLKPHSRSVQVRNTVAKAVVWFVGWTWISLSLSVTHLTHHCTLTFSPPIRPLTRSTPAVQGAVSATPDAQGPQPRAGGAGRLPGAVQLKQLCRAGVVDVQRLPEVREAGGRRGRQPPDCSQIDGVTPTHRL
jgi:hypothetical protein